MDKLACRTYGVMLFLAAFFDGFKPPPGWHPVLPETVLIAVPFTGRCIRLLATHFGSDYRMSRLDVSNHSGCEYDQLPVNNCKICQSSV
jgi:hypothetical protein